MANAASEHTIGIKARGSFKDRPVFERMAYCFTNYIVKQSTGRPELWKGIGFRKGKFCNIAARPVNKGLGMLQMSSAKWKYDE
jgi:hypothetical protein